MKTQKNNQETGNNLVAKVVLFGSAVLLSAVLIGKTTSAQISQGQLSNSNMNGEQASLVVGQSSDTKEADAAFEIINAEVYSHLNNSSTTEETMPSETNMVDLPSLTSNEIALEKAIEYNPEEFVEAELAMEKESLTNEEAFEIESAHQIEVLTNESQYNAEKFVEAEIQLEIENAKTNEALLKSAEASTVSVADQEISKYAEKVILAVDSWKNDKGYFSEAEHFTASGADQEITKYAKKTILKIETEDTQMAESEMTTNDDFNSPEA